MWLGIPGAHRSPLLQHDPDMCLLAAMLARQPDKDCFRQATLVAVVCEDGSCHYLDMLQDTRLGYRGVLRAHLVQPAAAVAQLDKAAPQAQSCAWGYHAYALHTIAGVCKAFQ